MSGINWEKFGEEISKTVQDAVEHQDFEKLNQMITNTVNQTVNTVGNSVKTVINASQGKYKEYKDSQQTANYSTFKTYTTDKNKEKANSSSGMQYSNVKKERSSTALSKIPVKIPSKVGAGILAAVGYVVGTFHLFGFICFLIASIFMGDAVALILGLFMTLFAGAVSAAGFTLGIGQSKKRKRIERFKIYLSKIGARQYCNISELAQKSNISEMIVVKDMEYMIKNHWFLEGHLDKQHTCVMVTDKMYSEYCQLEQRRELADKETKAREEQQKKIMEEKIASGKNLSPEVQAIIDKGDEYVRKIRACNDEIPGEVISEKIYRIEMLVDKIFDLVEQNPKSVSDIHKLMEYYLPTTVKLLEAYAQMDAQPTAGENIHTAKKEIEATLDTLNVAFEKLLDSLFQETAWDISSDISVLNTMLAQEGLKEDGLKGK